MSNKFWCFKGDWETISGEKIACRYIDWVVGGVAEMLVFLDETERAISIQECLRW
jgi:hypothetical protein